MDSQHRPSILFAALALSLCYSSAVADRKFGKHSIMNVCCCLALLCFCVFCGVKIPAYSICSMRLFKMTTGSVHGAIADLIGDSLVNILTTR